MTHHASFQSAIACAVAAFLAVLAPDALCQTAQPKTVIPAENPIPYAAGWWKACEERVAAAQGKPVDIMFIGDSITQNFIEHPTEKWKLVGNEVWQKHYANRNVLNFGVGSDGTEHILWRMDHMNIKAFTPMVIVLLAGVNDMRYPAADIAAGTRAVLDKCLAMFPRAKVVLMAILPNGRNWPRTQEVNAITRTFADNKTIFCLDLTRDMPMDHSHFTGVGGDAVHLTPEGYEIWASHLDPLLDRLMELHGPGGTR
jgi:beta-glucosidase